MAAILEKVDSKPMLKTLRQAEFRWPVLGDVPGREHQWSAEQWSLLRTLAEMRNQHGKSVLIRLYVSPDDKNSSHYIIKVRFTPFEHIVANEVAQQILQSGSRFIQLYKSIVVFIPSHFLNKLLPSSQGVAHVTHFIK